MITQKQQAILDKLVYLIKKIEEAHIKTKSVWDIKNNVLILFEKNDFSIKVKKQ